MKRLSTNNLRDWITETTYTSYYPDGPTAQNVALMVSEEGEYMYLSEEASMDSPHFERWVSSWSDLSDQEKWEVISYDFPLLPAPTPR